MEVSFGLLNAPVFHPHAHDAKPDPVLVAVIHTLFGLVQHRPNNVGSLEQI